MSYGTSSVPIGPGQHEANTETNDVPQIDVKAARAWLIEAGFQVGQRGRLNAEHRAAYLAHLARS